MAVSCFAACICNQARAASASPRLRSFTRPAPSRSAYELDAVQMQASCLVHREVRRKQLLSLLTAFIVPFESTSWVASRGSGRRAPAAPGSAAAALRARAARPAAARIRPPARRRRAAPPARPAAPAPPSSPAGRRCRPAPSPAGAAGLRNWVAVMSSVTPGAARPPKSASAAEQPGRSPAASAAASGRSSPA